MDARQRLSIYQSLPSADESRPTVTFRLLHCNITFLDRDSSDLVCSGFSAKLFYVLPCPLTGATSHDHLIPTEVVVLIIFHESSSLRSFFYTFPLLLPSLSGRHIYSPQDPSSNTLKLHDDDSLVGRDNMSFGGQVSRF
jgi:hypothetical protein